MVMLTVSTVAKNKTEGMPRVYFRADTVAVSFEWAQAPVEAYDSRGLGRWPAT